jgi:hypothetical protein
VGKVKRPCTSANTLYEGKKFVPDSKYVRGIHKLSGEIISSGFGAKKSNKALLGGASKEK